MMDVKVFKQGGDLASLDKKKIVVLTLRIYL
jgi:hypothetical protein